MHCLLQGVDDEDDIDEPLPGGDVGEIADPEHVGRGHPKLPVHLVQRTRSLLVRNRRSVRLAADDALNTHLLHQPSHGATSDFETFPDELPPDLADAVDSPVLFENTQDLGSQSLVTTSAV